MIKDERLKIKEKNHQSSITNLYSSKGFSLLEVLLAVSIFAILVTGLVGGLIYGQEATATAGLRSRAVMLAEEGLEAVRNIKDGGFNDVAIGTHGLATASNIWEFSGSSDTTGVFTRQIDIANVDTDRKTITSTVTWQQTPSRTGSVVLTTRMANWLQTVSDWANPAQEASLDFSGTEDGLKIQVSSNYVYLVRNGGTPDFLVVDISTPASPSLVGSLSLSGNPTNIYVSGNYAYVSNSDDSQELQIINISTPASPSVTGTFDAAGTADGKGVFVVGTAVYLVRDTSSSDEFYIINASTPASPSSTGSLNLGDAGYEVWVSGTKAYVASGDNSQELQVVDITTPASPSIFGSYGIGGNTDAITVSGVGDTGFLGQGAGAYLIDISTPSTPSLTSTFAGAGTVNDIALNFGSADTFVYFVTANSNKEFELFDISVPASPVSVGSLNLTAFNGIAYDSVHDRAFLVGPEDGSEFVVIKPQ